MFNKKNIRKDSLTKLIVDSCYLLPSIKSLHIMLKLKNLNKINKLLNYKNLGIFEILFLQKVYYYILDYNQKYKKINSYLNFVVNLNGRKMFLFFKYLDFFIIPQMYKRNIKFNNLYNNNIYNFNIKSLNILSSLDSFYFDWNNIIFFEIKYNNLLFY